MAEIISSREELVNRIVTLHRDGHRIRGLARRFSVSRNTVRGILREHDVERETGHDALRARKAPRKSKLDIFVPLITELLTKYDDIRVERIYEELVKSGYDGGRSILKERLKILRPNPLVEPVERFETDPGLQGQMDWSPYKIKFRRTGRVEVLCFSYVLGFSRRHFIDFTLNRQFPTLIRRHQDAFNYFGGVPKQCLYDGEKTVVLRREAGRPVFNPKFLAFITHYNCRPIVCRPRTPRTKGKVENPFKYIEGNLLNGRDFDDLDDLRQFARWWLTEKSDKHKHRTTGRPPLELFLESEQAALRPLPVKPYDTSEIKFLICDREGFCTFETNRYSVPYRYIGEILVLRATEKEITVYDPEIMPIAHHERRLFGAHAEEKDPKHHQGREERYGVEPVKEQFLALGEGAEAFLQGLLRKKSRSAGLWMRLILGMKAHYHSDDIAAALRHALRYDAFDARSVERILRAKARPRTLEEARNERASEELRTKLPRIEQRSLDEYNVLLTKLEEYDEGDDDE